MADYYTARLAADRLRRCYQIAPPRVRQYLLAELDFALGSIRPGDSVLDLGCGYGRTLPDVAAKALFVVGIDNSPASVTMARETVTGLSNVSLGVMDAAELGLAAGRFDVVLCLQNGISAFHRDQRTLLAEALRVCRASGKVLLSTYAERFWPQRLEWFRRQAAEGLLGEIDEERTGAGRIVCRDGFTASTVAPEDFRRLAEGLPAVLSLVEVDGSSLVCELRHRGEG